jgi:hypothetical protein
MKFNEVTINLDIVCNFGYNKKSVEDDMGSSDGKEGIFIPCTLKLFRVRC